VKGGWVVLRSILAVVVGFVVAMILAFGTDYLLVLALPGMFPKDQPTPTAFLILSLAYLFLYGILGGYLTAAVAGRAELKHGLALGLVFLALGVISTVFTLLAPAGSRPPDETPPLWYVACCLALSLPGPLAGGWLRALGKGKSLAGPGKVS
jgi:hypothetical protein